MANDPRKGHRDNLNNSRPEVAKSYRELTRRAPYSARSELQRQSEMAKPYAGDGYQAMEHWFPGFYPQPWTWPGPGDVPGGTYVDESYPGKDTPADEVPPGEEPGERVCLLKCDNATIEDCTEDYICNLHPDGVAREVYTTVRHVEPGDDLAGYKLDVIIRDGPKRDQTCGGGFQLGGDEVVIKFKDSNPGNGTLHLDVIMEAIKCKGVGEWGGLNVCTADLRIECCSCSQTTNPFEFDYDASSDTIVAGGSTTIYVLGGCPPFSWSVSGLGYSIAESTTDYRWNIVSCADGECDTDYAPMVYITITDDCGTVVKTVLQNTCGQWVDQNSPIRQVDSDCPDMCEDYPECTGSWCFDDTNTGYHYYGSFCPSPCGEPACNAYICAGNGYKADVYHWECCD